MLGVIVTMSQSYIVRSKRSQTRPIKQNEKRSSFSLLFICKRLLPKCLIIKGLGLGVLRPYPPASWVVPPAPYFHILHFSL
jgi:hypothetical protein